MSTRTVIVTQTLGGGTPVSGSFPAQTAAPGAAPPMACVRRTAAEQQIGLTAEAILANGAFNDSESPFSARRIEQKLISFVLPSFRLRDGFRRGLNQKD